MCSMTSQVIIKLWCFDRNIKKCHALPEEMYTTISTSLCDMQTLSRRGRSHPGNRTQSLSLPEIQWIHQGGRILNDCPREWRFRVANITKRSPKKTSGELLWTCGHWRHCVATEKRFGHVPLNSWRPQSRHQGRHLLDGCPRKWRFTVASVTKRSPKKTSGGLLWTHGH